MKIIIKIFDFIWDVTIASIAFVFILFFVLSICEIITKIII